MFVKGLSTQWGLIKAGYDISLLKKLTLVNGSDDKPQRIFSGLDFWASIWEELVYFSVMNLMTESSETIYETDRALYDGRRVLILKKFKMG